MEKKKENLSERPPIIAVMGHIDHGKSTLLDFIRKTNIVAKEAGGITQHISAYELVHETPAGEHKKITFIDTPGHAAFSKMRSRGAEVADIVILIVAADDGVNVQTLEALKTIQDSKTPYLVAINKIDKPNADIEKIKTDLATNGVYLEGYGGNISFALISAKTGKGVDDLLDTLLLMAEMAELKKDDSAQAEGFVLESSLDPKKGGMATLVIKNGTLKQGEFLVIDDGFTPIRSVENFMGKKINEATASSPVRITGFSTIPAVGSRFISATNKKEAEEIARTCQKTAVKSGANNFNDTKIILPIIVKADFCGTVEAIEKELKKLETEKVKINILTSGVGNISDAEIKTAITAPGAMLLGFNVKVDRDTMEMARLNGIEPKIFNIIYEINDAVSEEIKKRTPKEKMEKILGQARVLKLFNKQKDRQVIGGTVFDGIISSGAQARIKRQDNEIGLGKIIELQEQKVRAKEVKKGSQFGAMVESKTTIAENDGLEIFEIVEV